MVNGWIKLHREITESSLWKGSTNDQRVIMITILLKANASPASWIWKGHKMEVNPGQFITSLPKLAEEVNTKIQVVRTALRKFGKHEFLTDESTTTGRLITIINWGTYQGNNQDTNSQTNRRLTDGQQTPNRRLTANKKDKNYKKDNNDKKKEKKTPPPDNYIPSANIIKIAKEENINDLDTELEKCFDHYKSVGKNMVDWDAVVRGWLRRQKNFTNTKKISRTEHNANFQFS